MVLPWELPSPAQSVRKGHLARESTITSAFVIGRDCGAAPSGGPKAI
jgi:hypothetical protein